MQTSLFTVTGKVFDPATFQVLPDPNSPSALNDVAATEAGLAVTIDVLANDTIDGAAVDPATSVVTVLPAGALFGPNSGTAVVNPDQTVTYTPAAGFAGIDTFGYQLTVGDLVSSTATVTVTVTPGEVLAVTRAELDLRRLEWRIQGNDNIDGVTLTVHAGPTVDGPVIGSAVASGGKWQFRGRATSNPGVTRISVQSFSGEVLLNQPLRVR